MFTCQICSKSFKTRAALNGHKRLHGESGGTYTVQRTQRNAELTYSCLCCGKAGKYRPSRQDGKYCSKTCQAEYNWLNIYKPKIEADLGGNKSHLKRYLRESRGDKCQECNTPPLHNRKPLVLQLDHVDGNSDNNARNNLRLLCPNCHSQTDTFCGKNKDRGKETKRNKYLRNYQTGTPSL